MVKDEITITLKAGESQVVSFNMSGLVSDTYYIYLVENDTNTSNNLFP